MKSYALLSVSDKTGIEDVARALVNAGVSLLSTGGTYRQLEAAHIPVEEVADYTQFPEMLDGRVKTLHPLVHGGLLARRDLPEHCQVMEEYGIRAIDYVIVNLYPFKETILKPDVNLEEAIEQIDIGGPTMLRSAAKNYQSVTVVTDPADYQTLINQLSTTQSTSLAFRQYCASKVFGLTAHYDTLITRYLESHVARNETEYPAHPWSHHTLTYVDGETLRYGENSHQEATWYKDIFAPESSLTRGRQLNGKQLSYNNLRDADSAIAIAQEFHEPVAVALKHQNPCGVAIGETIEEAFARCYQADSVSIFGGIVVLNRPVTLTLAESLADIFLEIVIAPQFEAEALALLQQKANLRLIELDLQCTGEESSVQYQGLQGGMLVQSLDQSDELAKDRLTELPDAWTLVTETAPTTEQIQAMNLAMRVVKHVKSNAIVVGNEYMTLGIGAGQMNRVGAARIALEQAQAQSDELRSTYVMASDAFFPMPDTVTLAHEAGIHAIIQPGGSLRDQDSIDVCNQTDMAMVTTGIRHFNH